MNLLRRFYALGSAVTLSLAFVGGEASAQTVSVAFSAVDGVAPVPLSPWAMGLMGVFVALLAWRVLRQKSPGRGWPLVLLASLGLMFFGASKSWLPEAVAAIGVTTFNLAFPSPTISPNLVLGQDISVINATGQMIRISEVKATNSASFFLYFPSQTPACAPNLVLPPAAGCYVLLAPSIGGD